MRRKHWFVFQINNNCTRACSHCFVNAVNRGPRVAFADIERILGQVAQVVHQAPATFDPDISLTGGEVLQYSDNGRDVGDIVDVLHRNGLQAVMTTRGWTDSEISNGSLAWRNFESVAARFQDLPYVPSVHVSFDTYTFDDRGDGEFGLQMARNAVLGFQGLGARVTLHSVVSVERAGRTWKAVHQLMQSCGFKINPATNPGQPDEMPTEVVGQIIVQTFRKTGRLPSVEYTDGTHTVLAKFWDFMPDGRAEHLHETKMLPAYNCGVATGAIDAYVIRHDLGVTACCASNYNSIPPIGYLHQESLQEVLGRFGQYSAGVAAMRADIWQDLQRDRKDICEACPKCLPKYWPVPSSPGLE